MLLCNHHRRCMGVLIERGATIGGASKGAAVEAYCAQHGVGSPQAPVPMGTLR
jgi:hypothetical protein